MIRERRRNVRVRPSADYDIVVEYLDGLLTVRLAVLDVAIGGMGLVVDDLFAQKGTGDQLELAITFPGSARFVTRAELRHSAKKAGGKCGISLANLSETETHALRAAVAELQERGFTA